MNNLVARIFSVLVISTLILLAVPTDAAAQTTPAAQISDLVIDRVDDGFEISFTLRVQNMRGRQIRVGAWVVDADTDTFIFGLNTDPDFLDPQGKITAQSVTTPSYDKSLWDSGKGKAYTLYLPDKVFPSGPYSWYPYIEVQIDETGENILDDNGYFSYITAEGPHPNPDSGGDVSGEGSGTNPSGADCPLSSKYEYGFYNISDIHCFKSIVIFIHGVASDPSVYQNWKSGLFSGDYPELGNTLYISFNWEADSINQASDQVGGRANSVNGMSDRAFFAVWKLGQTVARMQKLFPELPITIVSHSQGTVVTLAALQEGMTADFWVLMGSPLDQEIVAYCEDGEETDLALAASGVKQAVWNLWSEDDDIAALKGGIGAYGLATPCGDESWYGSNVYDDEIPGIDHFEFMGDDNSWWDFEHMRDQMTGEQFDYLLYALGGGDSEPVGYLSEDIGKFNSDASWANLEPWYYPNQTTGRSWSFPDHDHDSFYYTFLLPQGLLTGWYMDDKDRAEYQISCSSGTPQVRIVDAVDSVFNYGTDWVRVYDYYSDEYSVGGFYDATIWVQLYNAEPGIAECELTMEAWDD